MVSQKLLEKISRKLCTLFIIVHCKSYALVQSFNRISAVGVKQRNSHLKKKKVLTKGKNQMYHNISFYPQNIEKRQQSSSSATSESVRESWDLHRMGNGLYILFSKRVHGKNGESSAQIQKYINSRHIRQGMPAIAYSATKLACISICVYMYICKVTWKG